MCSIRPFRPLSGLLCLIADKNYNVPPPASLCSSDKGPEPWDRYCFLLTYRGKHRTRVSPSRGSEERGAKKGVIFQGFPLKIKGKIK